MVSLTDSSYKLPTIEALSCFEQFHHGTTLPMAIWGVDTKSGERGQYVVKFKNQTRMSNSASAFEYLGAWMALEMGLFAAEPVVVTISEDFGEIFCFKRSKYTATSANVKENPTKKVRLDK